LPLSATEAVSPAIEHAKKQLFQPFRFAQWARLALVGFLTGEISSGGGCNAPTSFPNTHGSGDDMPNIGAFHKLLDIWHAHPALIAGLVTLGIVFCILFWLVLAYLNSRMRFVLFDSIVTKECRLGEFWKRRKECAWRYFLWQLVFGLGSMMGFAILTGIPLAIAWAAGWLQKPRQHILPLVLGGLVLFVVFLAYTIAVKVIQVLAKDFVVPYMAVENLTVMDGWRRLWSLMKPAKGSYAGYILMKLVLAIAAGIIFGIIVFIVILIIGIPAFIAGIVAGVAAAGIGLTWNVFTITLTIVLGAIGLVVLLCVISFVSVPVAVFFPAYSIHFLASRYPGLDALLHPAPPAPPVSPAPEILPPMPPLLPPEPSPIG
jgi:hypothetical protein